MSESTLIYGTAWKHEKTSKLIYEALCAGFRTFDTAAQPRHYREAEVGDGIRAGIRDGIVTRDMIKLQTKFTWTSGQDIGTQPFDVDAPIPIQVRQSVDQSLFNLRPHENQDLVSESYIDCLILHFPLPTLQQTLQAWTTLETYHPAKVRRLGISNTSLEILQVLFMARSVTVNPSIIQNRFHVETGFDLELREFCEKNDVVYQCFGVLKSNQALLGKDCVVRLSRAASVGLQSSLYFLVLGLGRTAVLNGTTRQHRMESDLEDIRLLQAWRENCDKGRLFQQLMEQFLEVLKGN